MPSWPTFEKVVGSGRRESERRMGAVQQQRLQREGFRLEVTRAGKHYSGGSRKPAADSRRPTRLGTGQDLAAVACTHVVGPTTSCC
jgi:hypothetical protein